MSIVVRENQFQKGIAHVVHACKNHVAHCGPATHCAQSLQFVQFAHVAHLAHAAQSLQFIQFAHVAHCAHVVHVVNESILVVVLQLLICFFGRKDVPSILCFGTIIIVTAPYTGYFWVIGVKEIKYWFKRFKK